MNSVDYLVEEAWQSDLDCGSLVVPPLSALCMVSQIVWLLELKNGQGLVEILQN